MAGQGSLLAVLHQPELFSLINGHATWYLPPVLLNKAALDVVGGLGQTSTAVHTAAAVGARGYPNARFELQLRWVITFHGVWTDAWYIENARLHAIVTDTDYVELMVPAHSVGGGRGCDMTPRLNPTVCCQPFWD